MGTLRRAEKALVTPLAYMHTGVDSLCADSTETHGQLLTPCLPQCPSIPNAELSGPLRGLGQWSVFRPHPPADGRFLSCK